MELESSPPDVAVASGVAARLHDVLRRLFGQEAPVRIRAWDGSEAGPRGGASDLPVVTVESRRALRRLLWRPDELGLARGLIAGELRAEGSLLAALERLAPYARSIGARPDLSAADRAVLLRTAVELGAVGPQPKPPPEEITGQLRRTVIEEASASVEGVVDRDGMPAEFAEAVLGSTYLCAAGFWGTGPAELAAADGGAAGGAPADGAGADGAAAGDGTAAGDGAGPTEAHLTEAHLTEAQLTGAALAGRKLGLADGMRLLDVDCEWGGLIVRLARDHDIEAVGITRSAVQAAVARCLVDEAGVGDRVRIVTGDWRDLDEAPFDAVTGGGLGDFVAAADFGTQVSALAERLRPGGRLLLDQAISRTREPVAPERSFLDAYVAPQADLPRLGEIVDALELAGLEVRTVESLRFHQLRTLRAWTANLERQWEECLRYVPAGRLRVWQLYLAVSVLALEAGRVGVHEVVAVRPAAPEEPGPAHAPASISAAGNSDIRREMDLPASKSGQA